MSNAKNANTWVSLDKIRTLSACMPVCLPACLCLVKFVFLPTLQLAVSNMKNANTRDSLDKIRTTVLENLAVMPPAPSAQMAPVPPQHEAVSGCKGCWAEVGSSDGSFIVNFPGHAAPILPNADMKRMC